MLRSCGSILAARAGGGPSVKTLRLVAGYVLAGILGALLLHLPRDPVVGASAVPVWTARSFYLTKTFHQGNNALRACSAGYHMASLWEVYNVSTLKYETILGATAPDSGSGPPTFKLDQFNAYARAVGWIRTGAHSQGSSPPSQQAYGVANCFVWTSNSQNARGSAVGLAGDWSSGQTPGGQIPQIEPWVQMGWP
jgi:hypothetical protein